MNFFIILLLSGSMGMLLGMESNALEMIHSEYFGQALLFGAMVGYLILRKRLGGNGEIEDKTMFMAGGCIVLFSLGMPFVVGMTFDPELMPTSDKLEKIGLIFDILTFFYMLVTISFLPIKKSKKA